jgi:hypothetical protein
MHPHSGPSNFVAIQDSGWYLRVSHDRACSHTSTDIWRETPLTRRRPGPLPGISQDLTDEPSTYGTLAPLIGGVINRKQVVGHWDEILRLATSIKHGSVTASLMLRKLGAYPRQNGLAVALRELGKVERTLFLLQNISSPELRRRIHVGLNKGEAKNALARAVFFNRLGELRDRTHENQRHRASGLNLVVAAIVLWNTVYLEQAVAAIRQSGQAVSDETLAHLSPLKWEHINLTGDYHWRKDAGLQDGKLRPLRVSKP